MFEIITLGNDGNETLVHHALSIASLHIHNGKLIVYTGTGTGKYVDMDVSNLHKKIIRDFITVPTYVVSGGLRWLGFVDIASKDAVGTALGILRQEDLAQLSERIAREGLI